MSGFVIFWASFVPWLLLLCGLQWLPGLRGWRGTIAAAVLATLLVFVPWISHPLPWWSSGLSADFSIVMVGLLLIAIIGRASGRVLFSRSEWNAAWIFGACAATGLYPSAFGVGPQNFDAYALGWPGLFWGESAVLFGAVAIAAAFLVWRGNRFGFLLLFASAAFTANLQESDNFWDYLIDPVYAAVSLVMIPVIAWRRCLRPTVACFLMAIVLIGSGCHRTPRADLVFLNGAEPETLDPALITGQPEGRVANALFEGLLAFDQRGQPQPGAAARWEVSEDGRVYTFHLREGLVWSDGTPLTARDFVESWHRTLEPETASEYAYQLYYIRGAKAFNEGADHDFSKVGISAPDDRTLRVELENPTPFFPDLCAFVTLLPVPLHVIEKYGDDWIKPGRIVGNGAYILDEWRINDRIRLRKNPRYWDAKNVALETIDILPVSKGNTAFNLYAAGQADLMMDKGLVPPALLGEIKKRADFHAAPFLGTYFLRYNCEKKPFSDPRVRRAFSLAVDKKSIVDRITQAGELPADGFVPPGAGGYESYAGPVHDPDEARRLLAEAGFPGGEGFPMVTYLYSEGEMNEAIAVELQGMWRRELGINVQLLRQEWKVYLRSLSTLDYDIARSSWVGDYPDPNTFLDMFVTGGGNNRTGWGDTDYDRYIAEAAAETDHAKRFDLLRNAEKILVDTQMPVCPIFFYVGIQLYDAEKFGGIEGNVLDEHPLRTIHKGKK